MDSTEISKHPDQINNDNKKKWWEYLSMIAGIVFLIGTFFHDFLTKLIISGVAFILGAVYFFMRAGDK